MVQNNRYSRKKTFTSKPMNEDASSGTYYFKTASIMKNTLKKLLKRY